MFSNVSLVVLGAIAIVLVGGLIAFTRFYRKVDQGRALIINPMTGLPKVSFTGGVVWPVVNRAEVMDISVKTIEL